MSSGTGFQRVCHDRCRSLRASAWMSITDTGTVPDNGAQCQDHPKVVCYQNIGTQLVEVGGGWEAQRLPQAVPIGGQRQGEKGGEGGGERAQTGNTRSGGSHGPNAQDAEDESCQER